MKLTSLFGLETHEDKFRSYMRTSRFLGYVLILCSLISFAFPIYFMYVSHIQRRAYRLSIFFFGLSIVSISIGLIALTNQLTLKIRHAFIAALTLIFVLLVFILTWLIYVEKFYSPTPLVYSMLTVSFYDAADSLLVAGNCTRTWCEGVYSQHCSIKAYLLEFQQNAHLSENECSECASLYGNNNHKMSACYLGSSAFTRFKIVYSTKYYLAGIFVMCFTSLIIWSALHESIRQHEKIKIKSNIKTKINTARVSMKSNKYDVQPA